MKTKIKKFLSTLKYGFKTFLCFVKTHALFCAFLFLLDVGCLVSVSMVTTPFDGYCVQEITERITLNAKKSPYGLSVNSIQMKARGTSDYFLYSDNDMRNFQTRNLKFEGEKNYLFAAYKPYGGIVPLSISNKDGITSSQCSILLTESKYEQNDFYFDLPIVSGDINRFLQENEIIILDKLANKLSDYQDYSDLIGTTISGKMIAPIGLVEKEYTIKAVLDSDNNLGKTLYLTFGENVVFMSEYNVIPMEGFCYFYGSTTKSDNKDLADFVYNKYKSTYKASRYLEVGYNAQYSFYEYSEDGSQLQLGSCNKALNNVIDFYSGILPLVICVFGAIALLSSIIFLLLHFAWNKKNIMFENRGVKLFAAFLLSGVALLISSLMYKFIPIVTIIGHQKMITSSYVTSSAIIIAWIVLVSINVLLTIKEPK